LNLGNKAKWKSHLDIITMPPVGAKGVLHPLFSPHTPRLLLARPTGSGPAHTLPRWLLPDTDSRIGKKTERGPISILSSFSCSGCRSASCSAFSSFDACGLRNAFEIDEALLEVLAHHLVHVHE
jgi:hypothetical protein